MLARRVASNCSRRAGQFGQAQIERQFRRDPQRLGPGAQRQVDAPLAGGQVDQPGRQAHPRMLLPGNARCGLAEAQAVLADRQRVRQLAALALGLGEG